MTGRACPQPVLQGHNSPQGILAGCSQPQCTGKTQMAQIPGACTQEARAVLPSHTRWQQCLTLKSLAKSPQSAGKEALCAVPKGSGTGWRQKLTGILMLTGFPACSLHQHPMGAGSWRKMAYKGRGCQSGRTSTVKRGGQLLSPQILVAMPMSSWSIFLADNAGIMGLQLGTNRS